jgi:hypothetical protein
VSLVADPHPPYANPNPGGEPTGTPRGAAPERTAPERAARAELRRQIVTLERQLSDALATAFVHATPDALERLSAPASRRARGAPRLLDLGELEAVRDALAARLGEARALLSAVGERQEEARLTRERMLREPHRHRFVRVARRDLGEPGCGYWEVRPRLGLVGMLMGWWQVKVSSGCPLAT